MVAFLSISLSWNDVLEFQSRLKRVESQKNTEENSPKLLLCYKICQNRILKWTSNKRYSQDDPTDYIEMIKEAHFMKFKNGKLKAFMTTNNLLYHSITFTTFYPTSDNNIQVLFSKLQKSCSRWTNTNRKCIKLLLNGLVWFLVCCSVNRGQHNISRLITNKKFQLLGVTALHSKISNGTSAAVSRLRAAQLHVVFISRNNDSILNLSFPVHPVHFALAFQTISKDYPQLFKIDRLFDFQCHWIRVFFFMILNGLNWSGCALSRTRQRWSLAIGPKSWNYSGQWTSSQDRNFI